MTSETVSTQVSPTRRMIRTRIFYKMPNDQSNNWREFWAWTKIISTSSNKEQSKWLYNHSLRPNASALFMTMLQPGHTRVASWKFVYHPRIASTKTHPPGQKANRLDFSGALGRRLVHNGPLFTSFALILHLLRKASTRCQIFIPPLHSARAVRLTQIRRRETLGLEEKFHKPQAAS